MITTDDKKELRDIVLEVLKEQKDYYMTQRDKGEILEKISDVRTELANVRTELKSEISDLKVDIIDRINKIEKNIVARLVIFLGLAVAILGFLIRMKP